MSEKTANEINETENISSETEETEAIEVETVEKEKYDELYDKYLRTLAEYDNFKKRSQKEKDDIFSFAVADTIEKLLPVADNLDRAILALGENEHSEFAEGVKMVSKQLYEIFEKIGVTEIKAIGEQFDPNIHNAVMHIEDENIESNIITEEFMKGYKYKERVIRHSMVKVAN